MSTAEFHELEIASVRPQSDVAVSLCFSVPEELIESYRFIPGQYLTLRATVDGQDIRRSYSICSAIQRNPEQTRERHLTQSATSLEVGIKSVPGGLFSNYAMSLRAGDTVKVMTPQGRFNAVIGGEHRYLLLAVGSGITPCLSIAKSVLDGEPDSRITLVYGNRTSATMMFKDDIHALKDHYIERFRLINIMSAEQQEADVLNGRIDEQKIDMLTDRGVLAPQQYDACYICGPQQMMTQTAAALETLGVDKDRIFTELFVADASNASTSEAPKHVLPESGEAANQGSKEDSGIAVTVMIDGVRREIVVNPATDTVLSAAK